MELRGASYFGLLTAPKAEFACGSVVLFFLVHKKIHRVDFL